MYILQSSKHISQSESHTHNRDIPITLAHNIFYLSSMIYLLMILLFWLNCLWRFASMLLPFSRQLLLHYEAICWRHDSYKRPCTATLLPGRTCNKLATHVLSAVKIYCLAVLWSCRFSYSEVAYCGLHVELGLCKVYTVAKCINFSAQDCWQWWCFLAHTRVSGLGSWLAPMSLLAENHACGLPRKA